MSSLPSLYLITDRRQLPPGRQLVKLLEELLPAGLRMVQLREKDLSAAELLPIAMELRNLTRAHDCLLLINDRIDVALAVEADGVHLGGHSLPVIAARKILGPDRLIGVSTHSVAEVRFAAEQGADFVTFGPVYYTPSKAVFGAPVGLEKLSAAGTVSPIPIYGLGGINLENAAAVAKSDAHGIALISALQCAGSPAKALKNLSKILSG